LKILCEISGGYDSACVAQMLSEQGHELTGFFVNYGQPYQTNEYMAAMHVADRLGFSVQMIHCQLGLGLPDGSVPAAYVPIRNLVIGTLMANRAEALGIRTIAVGSKTTEYRPNDPYCFYDCTTEFYQRMANLVTLASQPGHGVQYIQPLIVDGCSLSKAEVVQKLIDTGWNLRNLWNCYGTGTTPCMQCKNCIEMRDLAFPGYSDWWPSSKSPVQRSGLPLAALLPGGTGVDSLGTVQTQPEGNGSEMQ
jgi:7-cyano-7-deazaguanine synthase in queuosine biosynthesis